jgi:hypothetical protein
LARTLKHCLPWAQSFATIAELRAAPMAFKRRDNEERLIERHGFRPAAQARAA